MSDRTSLILIDPDPIFRLGLSTALASFADLQILAEADNLKIALEKLAEFAAKNYAVDLVILEFDLSTNQPTAELQCQQLKAQYPQLPILLISSLSRTDQLIAAKTAGIEGYCPKGTEINVLVQAIRQLLAGQEYWHNFPTINYSIQDSGIASNLIDSTTSSIGDRPTRPPTTWHYQARRNGIQQINNSLAEVTSQLKNPNLSNLDWLFWSGRRRELLAARWLVNQLLPGDVVILQPVQNTELPLIDSQPADRAKNTIVRKQNYLTESSNLPQQSIFDTTRVKLQSRLQNITGEPIEIEILRLEKRRELLELILQRLEAILDELRYSQVEPHQLPQILPVVLRDLWQASIHDFFGKYYTLPIGDGQYEVVNVLLQSAGIVQSAILNKIPLVAELFSYLLFETPIVIDNAIYAPETFAAKKRTEALLENLIIQVANGVVQPLLNYFADIEVIKENFYDRSLVSTREISRFRNNLSWKYRIYQYIKEPIAIFESRYSLLVFSDIGIKQVYVYAPRRQELEKLRGIPLAVTLAVEARDAIAPRLRATVSFISSGLIYVLTKVIGRGIGLIVRGIIQGVGNSLQESRYGRNGDREKKLD
ncbi:response regulator receiver protein [Crinalium epipsammum PCC 9333]|uniref:Response regulator receiver protein n=1 Tax=Crinalium epipsammum PCC 9333 TaxID=1173022 RepID=K9VXQ2_9CYAN|nr:DUF3685 domain-containing protein [Crinalium epipsammum]AFZ12893.1 response regulator receiver protein [Crinalium epipsammum PCC 9333]